MLIDPYRKLVTSSLIRPIQMPVYNTNYNLNNDPRILARFVKKYRYMTLDKWLYNDLIDLLNYIIIENDRTDVIKNIDKLDKKAYVKDSDEIIDKKIEFIEKYILSEKAMRKIILKTCNNTNIELIELPNNEHILQKSVKHYLKKLLLKAISYRNKHS